ncbi:Uncharacterized protein APZ42_022324 [Daphnia magna]|uniref:Uncharacterized protein n=2 Tax=Daphnia magna TaxID=35525 RepID=A0A0P5DXD3_9CRUS|nr:hypothetical protein OUZ56_015012 [Daphnia magna]KZS12247.1 Uncharacterized protein APZ42_022324 [Daphnia magna]
MALNVHQESKSEVEWNPSQERLIVVSNRLPFVLKRDDVTGKLVRKSSAGGLVTAVAPVVVDCGGRWVGWTGDCSFGVEDEIPEASEEDTTPTAGLLKHQVVPVNLNQQQFDSYYNGCCNGTLWPLFHSMSDRAVYSTEFWQDYIQVNQLFADKTLEAIELTSAEGPGIVSLVWIHDYHLTLLPSILRQALSEKNCNARLGFFLHIPFPPWDIFRLLPWDDEILLGLLGCDMIGFHIEDYCINFLDCCHRRLGCRIDRKNLLVEYGNRIIKIAALPIGIPFQRFQKMAEEAPRLIKEKRQKIILGVDRLDYTKGLVHRLKAFERFLEKHPEHIEEVIFIQIAVPSRTDVKEYQDLKEEIDQVIGRINGRFSTANWSPIRYIYGCVSQSELAAYYRDAFIAMVTPLRDGMNLVAKEFVACQIEEPGVLILSPFAGAGETMQEALLINPYKIDDVAELICSALEMSRDEREVRMKNLRRREKMNNVDAWAQSFLKTIRAVTSDQGSDSKMGSSLMSSAMDDYDEYLSKYVGNAEKLALLLDYDGTLAPLAPHPDLAILPNETGKILQRLSNCPDVYISIISNRSVENVKKMVGIENITYAGKNGLEILHPDGTQFIYPLPVEYEDKVRSLLRQLQEEVCNDGAWVEHKGLLLTYHYSETVMHLRTGLIKRARELIEGAGLVCTTAYCALEAKPPSQWNKGQAALYILRTAFGVDWEERIRIVYAGDDFTDEAAIKALKGLAATFRVTSTLAVKTAADRRLSNNDSVLRMLKWIESHMTMRKPRLSSRSSCTVLEQLDEDQDPST